MYKVLGFTCFKCGLLSRSAGDLKDFKLCGLKGESTGLFNKECNDSFFLMGGLNNEGVEIPLSKLSLQLIFCDIGEITLVAWEMTSVVAWASPEE